MGERGRIELEPATGYSGNRLWVGRGRTTEITPPAGPGKTQWAGQLDHLARCIAEDRDPIVGGEEGLRDLRIIEAIYRSADRKSGVEGKSVSVCVDLGGRRILKKPTNQTSKKT